MTSNPRALLDKAIDAMAALHREAEPQTDHPDIPALIPASAFRAFVDAHARLLYERAHLPDETTEWRCGCGHVNASTVTLNVTHCDKCEAARSSVEPVERMSNADAREVKEAVAAGRITFPPEIASEKASAEPRLEPIYMIAGDPTSPIVGRREVK